jgi:hypothetical protein
LPTPNKIVSSADKHFFLYLVAGARVNLRAEGIQATAVALASPVLLVDAHPRTRSEEPVLLGISVNERVRERERERQRERERERKRES